MALFYGIHFINLEMMKDWVNLEVTQWLWTRQPWLGIQHLNHQAIDSTSDPRVLGKKPNYMLGQALEPNLNLSLWVTIGSHKTKCDD